MSEVFFGTPDPSDEIIRDLKRKVAELEADKARLSEALRKIVAIIKAATGRRLPLIAQILDVADAALSGSGSGWLSMDSAPKDGTEFQAWVSAWEPRCRFNPDTGAFEIWGRVDYDMDGWEVYPHLSPTHWMPLPAAPQQGGE